MIDNIPKPTTIDDYIKTFPEDVQARLELIRKTIKSNCPEAQETISYAIPTFKLKGKVLVHFAGFKNHIGLYALPTGNEAFAEEFSKYKTGKGSVQFPLNEELPLDLIINVVQFRIKEISEDIKLKK